MAILAVRLTLDMQFVRLNLYRQAIDELMSMSYDDLMSLIKDAKQEVIKNNIKRCRRTNGVKLNYKGYKWLN